MAVFFIWNILTYTDNSKEDKIEAISPIFESASLLERVMGDHDFFKKMLNGFIQTYADADQRIQQKLAAGEQENASLLIHTIKGGAATISAIQLSEAAARLEIEVKKLSGNKAPDMSHFAQILKKTISTLKQHLD